MSRISRREVIKGKVTKVNESLLYFEVKETYRVYVDFSNSAVVSLPCLNDDIEVVNTTKICNSTFTVVIGPNTIRKCSTNSPIPDNAYSEILRAASSDVDELLAIDAVIRKLELLLTNHEIQSCISCLHQCILVGDANSGGFAACKKSFKIVQVKIPKDLQYANTNSQLYSFLNFDGECAFNAYPNRKLEKPSDFVHEYLFGKLTIANTHGYFTLQDDSVEVLVKFTSPHDHLYNFHNCLVLIKEYTVFTELYKDETQPTLHYILLNPAHVVIVLPYIDRERKKLFYGINEVQNANFKHVYFLQASKISEIIYGYNNNPECWMEGLIFRNEELLKPQGVYIIVPNELIELVPFIREHVVYKIFTDQKFKLENILTYRELYGMKQSKKVILLSCDTIFQETKLRALGMPDKVFEDFQEVRSHIANTKENYTTFSFVLKIEKKVFQPINFSSWFPKRHDKVQYFGDISNHQTRLIFRDAPSNSYIDLYLSNRENHVIPLGLVSNMKVKVRHVQVNKKKYLKATIFTSIEILDYCPEIRFSSVNLLFSDKCFWQWRTKTEPTLMGMYSYIPVNCVVHGTVLFRAVLDLRLDIVCVECKQVSRGASCSICNAVGRDISVFMVIHVQDSINPTFHMETDNISFLLELLGLRNQRGADAFHEECLQRDTVNVDFLKIAEGHQIEDAESNPVLQRVVTLIRSQINYKFYFLMDVVCVRQFSEGHKPWKLIDFECVC